MPVKVGLTLAILVAGQDARIAPAFAFPPYLSTDADTADSYTLKVRAVGPDVDVALGGKIARLPVCMLVGPHLLEARKSRPIDRARPTKLGMHFARWWD